MSNRLNWEKARSQVRGPLPSPPSLNSSGLLPPTEKQLRYLAWLARQAGVPTPKVYCRNAVSDQVGILKKKAARSG